MEKNSNFLQAMLYHFYEDPCKKSHQNSISRSQNRTYVYSKKVYLLVQKWLLHIRLL